MRRIVLLVLTLFALSFLTTACDAPSPVLDPVQTPPTATDEPEPALGGVDRDAYSRADHHHGAPGRNCQWPADSPGGL